MIPDFMLSQLFGNGDWISTVIWFGLFIVFIFFGPRLMATQTILKLEKDASELEQIAEKSRRYVVKSISKRPDKKLRNNVKNFMEFFAVPPVGTDPYGIIKKIDHVIRNSERRFRYFVRQVSPTSSRERRMNLRNALAGAMTTHQIAKIVRHYAELIKKYKIFQLGMVIQMQIPMIKSIARAAASATQAFVDETPIGDGIGPLVAANMMKGRINNYKNEEFAVTRSRIKGRTVFISKADGPGASTGYPGKFLIKFMRKNRITRIITVDAGMRLEGEKPGTIAEGVGVAMGGSGVDRYEIEEITVKRNIPLDAVAIKVSPEEALMPMKKEILNSVSNAIRSIENIVEMSGRGEQILIMGVGNTCGIGNSKKDVNKAVAKIRKQIRKMNRKKKKKVRFIKTCYNF